MLGHHGSHLVSRQIETSVRGRTGWPIRLGWPRPWLFGGGQVGVPQVRHSKLAVATGDGRALQRPREHGPPTRLGGVFPGCGELLGPKGVPAKPGGLAIEDIVGDPVLELVGVYQAIGAAAAVEAARRAS